jgi:hypothetical protein
VPEVSPGLVRQLRVQLNTHYGTAIDRDRSDCRVVPDAAAEVKEAIARRKLEIVKAPQQKCRLAVVEVPLGVQSNEHVVVEVPRIAVWRELVTAPRLGQSQDLPRPRTQELLARNARESIEQAGRPQPGHHTDPLGELATCSLKGLH